MRAAWSRFDGVASAGLALGGLGLGLGLVAFGGLALGHYARGGAALGKYVVGPLRVRMGRRWSFSPSSGLEC